MLVADPAERRANLQQVIDGLAVAEETGTAAASTSPARSTPKVWYGPDPRNLSQEFFDAAVEKRTQESLTPSNPAAPASPTR